MGTGVAMKVAIAATSIAVGAIAGVVAVSAVLVWTVTQRL